jgi:hypothetical protein
MEPWESYRPSIILDDYPVKIFEKLWYRLTGQSEE